MKRRRRPTAKSVEISIINRAGFFAEDKDVAAKIRDECITPALREGLRIVLNFEGVVGATQSFVHALIAAVIRASSSDALELMEFKSCNASVKGIVSIVVEYCQLDVGDDEGEARDSVQNSPNRTP